MGKHGEPREPRAAHDQQGPKPEPSGQEIMSRLRELTEDVKDVDLDKLDPEKIKARVDAPGSGKPDDATVEEQERILSKVARFLNVKTAGPIYTIPVRGKVFVGRLLTAQESLEVERRAGLVVGRAMTTGQMLTAWISELLGGSFGYAREGLPEHQVLLAHLDDPDRWPKLRPIEWMESRDPYLRGEEIEPLWLAYSKWKVEITPTADEIRFYYSRVG